MKKFIEWLTGEPVGDNEPLWWIALQTAAALAIFWFFLIVVFSF